MAVLQNWAHEPGSFGTGPLGIRMRSTPEGFLDPDTKYTQDTARIGLGNQQSRFNQVFGALSPLLGQLGQWGANSQQIGGTPTINTNPIWNPQQIQQQVNAGRAQNDQATQTQMRLAGQQMAGRGFGANSPLAAAIQGQLAGQNLATNADTERQTRMGMTQANAGHQLGAQTAWEAAYADRLKPWLSYAGSTQNALLAALSGLV